MSGIVAIDFETCLFHRGEMAPKIVCLSACSAHGNRLIVGDDEIEKYLDILLRQTPEIKIIGHTIAYDFACVLANYKEIWPLVWRAYDANGVLCTGIRERLLDIECGEFRHHNEEDEEGEEVEKKHEYSLKDLAQRRLKRAIEKGENTWRLRYSELLGVPQDQWPKEAREYALGDSQTTYDLYWQQEERAQRRQYTIPTQYDDTRADFALRLMSVWGICTNGARVQQGINTAQKQMEEFADTLVKNKLATVSQRAIISDLFGVPNKEPLKIKKNLKEIRLAISQHLKNPPLTPKGNICTDAETLGECNWPPFEALIEFNSLQKTTSTYLSHMIESPIHASFWAVGAVSDRTSCSAPNLQNPPRLPGVRECFVPRPGSVFLACDMATQELRTLAQSCIDLLGFSKLAECYKKDPIYDPHADFALRLARGDAERAKELRYRAKTANFGYAGGMGSEKFVKYAKNSGVIITSQDAKDLRVAWLEQWPEMPKYFAYVSNMIGGNSAITLTHPRSGFKRANCFYTDTCNAFFQTLANHSNKDELWQVTKRCFNDPASFLYGSRPVLFVHDEIILETPEEAGHDAAMEIEDVMAETMEKWTPDIPTKAEATLMRCWSKKTKRIFENGKMIPWKEE